MTLNLKIQDSFVESKIKNQKIILAVSGGADSQSMLKAVPHVSKAYGVECIAVGINHGLRKEADEEIDLAESLAKSMDIPFKRIKVRVESSPSLQAQARNARYSALYSFADSNNVKYITTAHHFDDRAETIMIRLIRGDRLGSLAVLPTISGRIFRPMLKVTKQEILRHCKRWNLSYANDPSNDDTHYLRVKIRKEIMPIFESINPKFKQRLNNLSDEIIKNSLLP